MVLEERIQAILLVVNPYHHGYHSPVELLATTQLRPFEIVVRPLVSGVGSVVEMVDQLKKDSGEQDLTSRFHCQVQSGCFGVVAHSV